MILKRWLAGTRARTRVGYRMITTICGCGLAWNSSVSLNDEVTAVIIHGRVHERKAASLPSI